MREKGIECDLDTVEQEIKDRDYRDSHRDYHPLKKADDAIVVDSSNIGFEDTFQVMCDLIIKELSIARED